MAGFFNPENRFFRFMDKVVDIICLSIIWTISIIPIFTFGAATSAMYYDVNKVVVHGRGYMWSDFWSSFRKNFKQTTPVGLIYTAICLFLAWDIRLVYQLTVAGEAGLVGFLFWPLIIISCLVVAWGLYLFPYLGRFTDSMGKLFKNTAIIMMANLGWSVLLFLIFVVAVALIYISHGALIVAVPGLYTVFQNAILEKIFRKYMSEEDIAAEDEANRDFSGNGY